MKSPIQLSIAWLLPAFLFLSTIGYSQAPFLSATASKSTVGVGEEFQISFTLNTKGSGFKGPDLSNFSVLSGPNSSQSVQLINGGFSQSLSYSYIIQAKSEGNFKIGPATIDVEGKKVISNVINLNVVKGNAAAAQNQKGQQGNSESGLSDKNIFIRANVNKQTVTQGEAIVVSFKLYTNVNIVNYSVKKMPAFNGFWNQDIELPQQLDLNTEVVDGISYRTGEIKKVVLFPQKSGLITIDPMELECIARIQVRQDRRSDPFGMFQNDPFFGMGGAKDVIHDFKSNSIKVNVKALPSNAPASFSGSVGRLDFNASMDKNETKENEPVTLKIKISGTGNLKLSEAPVINFPQDLETYDPKIIENLKVTSSGVTGSKTIEYLLIPRHEGSYTLEPVEFTYFDLDKNQYITQKSKAFTIRVTRGKDGPAMMSGGNEKSDFQLIGKDIRYIKIKAPQFTSTKSGFYGSLPFYTLSIMPLLLFAGFVSYRKRQEKLMGNITLLKSKKATLFAKKRLSTAEKLLNTPQQSGVFDEVSKALWGYVSDKLTIPVSELTKENASAAMQSKNAKTESIDEWLNVLQTCEMSRYGGIAAAGEPSQIYDRAIRIITKLEGEITA